MQRFITILLVFLMAQTSAFGDTYYEILGISKTASKEEIKNVYRKLAMKHHPDRHTTEVTKKKNEEIFKKIQEAYNILADESKRRDYDNNRTSSYEGGNTNYSRPRSRSPYEISEGLMAELRRNSHLTVEGMIKVGLEFLEKNLSFKDSQSEYELNMRVSILADIFNRVGAMADFPVMEAAYKTAFAYLKKASEVSAKAYNFNFNYGYDYLAGTYKRFNDMPTAENFEFRQRMYSVLKFAEQTRVQSYSDIKSALAGADSSQKGKTCAGLF